jgi:uncharacterized protein YbjT (DUF2867 family)
MNVVVFGATGMVGRAALLECLADPGVQRVVAIVRRSTGIADAKLVEVVHRDFLDYAPVAEHFRGVDACLFCLGVSSAGMKEADYTRVTYDFALAAARALKEQSPDAAFVYVSGAGTDSTARGRSMWARVKGRTENELLAMFSRAYMFRPGYIHPTKGVVSSTALYRVGMLVAKPLYPIVKALAPNAVTTSDTLGRAMIAAVRAGGPKRIVDVAEINALGR